MTHQLFLVTTVVARTAIVLVMLLVGIRLSGARHVGGMRVDDILMVLLVANAVQNAMTKGAGDLLVALGSAGALIIIGWFAAIGFHWMPMIERGVSGTPVVLVHDGALLRANMRRADVKKENVMAAVRKNGIGRVEDVKLAILEANGAISVVKDESR